MLYPDLNDLLSYKRLRLNAAVARKTTHRLNQGTHASPFRGQGLDFDAVRPYVPGDDVRTIDWRVTARTGAAHLKLFKEDKQRDVFLCIDMNARMRFGTRKTFKSIQAARCASLLGWNACLKGDRLHALGFGDVPGGLLDVSVKDGRKVLSKMLHMLVEPVSEEHQISLESALEYLARRAQRGSLIYVISDFLDLPAADSILGRLAARCEVVLISIHDAADCALAPAGVIGFCGLKAEKLYLNTDHAKGLKAYSEQWQSNREALNALNQRFRIPLISLTTESDIHRDLSLALKTNAKRKPCHS